MAQIQQPWTAHLDRAGMVASALCFVHCIAAPVVLSLSAVFSHFIPSEEHTHRVLAVFVTSMGAVAIGFGYPKAQEKTCAPGSAARAGIDLLRCILWRFTPFTPE